MKGCVTREVCHHERVCHERCVIMSGMCDHERGVSQEVCHH